MTELRDLIAGAIRQAASEQTYWVPGPLVSRIYADAVIDLILDLAGKGELLPAINRISR